MPYKDSPIFIRAPRATRDALNLAARHENRTSSNLALVVLERWLVENGYLAPLKEAQPVRRSRASGSRAK